MEKKDAPKHFVDSLYESCTLLYPNWIHSAFRDIPTCLSASLSLLFIEKLLYSVWYRVHSAFILAHLHLYQVCGITESCLWSFGNIVRGEQQYFVLRNDSIILCGRRLLISCFSHETVFHLLLPLSE